MSGMIERVAEALAQADGYLPNTILSDGIKQYPARLDYMSDARAAITAIRELTPEESGAASHNNQSLPWWFQATLEEVWTNIIDEALKDKPS